MDQQEEIAGNGKQTMESSRSSAFRRFLESLGEKFKKEKTFQAASTKELLKSETVEQETPKQPGIAVFIQEELDKKGLVAPEFKSEGSSGLGGTNEKINPEVLRKLREGENPPNGYIIGVGVSDIFSFIDAFPKNSPPKGIVMINTDPKVVEQERVLVELLKNGKLVDYDSNGNAQVSYSSKNWAAGLSEEEYFEHAYRGGKSQVATNIVTGRHQELLAKLAREGNIAVVQQDILNPDLLIILSKLPGLKDSNNIIYLSNISDWIWRAEAHKMMEERTKEYFERGDNLFVDMDYANLFRPVVGLVLLNPKSPHLNYFADTLGSTEGLDYHVRISTTRPVFTHSDFRLQ